MLKFSAIGIAVLIVLHGPAAAASGVAPVAAAMPSQALDSRIDSVIAPYFKASAPGATVIVVKDGKTVFRKAYGMANVAAKQPMTPEMVLRLGSITKQFTSTAILMLVDEGKIALDDEITKFLPDYPTRGKKITVEHLLTHTSGIVSYTDRPGYRANMNADLTVSQMIDSFKNDPLQFEPGSLWRYNNSGYFLLGAIIEKVSGQPYAKFIEQRIFVPLGMSRTAYEGQERGPVQLAAGYSALGSGFEASPALSMTQPYAAGALVSTVDDLARWDAAVSSGKLLKESSWKKAFTPYTLNTGKSTSYGYGWEMGKLQGVPMISHGGAINGFNTFALRLPAEKVYVAVLSNADSGLVRANVVASKAAAIAIGRPFPEYKEIALDRARLDAYAGVYQIDQANKRTFRRVQDHLVVQRAGRPAFAVRAFSNTGFFIPDTLDWFEFTRNAKGEVTQVLLHQGENIRVSQRIGEAPPERKAVKIANGSFDARAGRYQFTPQLTLELSREGDRFFAQGTGQPRLEIFALNENTFFSNEVDAELRFDPAAPEAPVLIQGGRDVKGRKLD
jgi:D-alanyl-D-alanine carboxypeptidase